MEDGVQISGHFWHREHWRIRGEAARPCPQAQEGGIMSFDPPKEPIFSKVNLGPSQKIVGQIRVVFSFGGTLGWDPPPPKTGS